MHQMTTKAQLLSCQTTSLVTFLSIPRSSRYHYWVSTEPLVNALLECLFCIGGMPMKQWTIADVTKFLGEIKYQQYTSIFQHQV